MRTSARAQRVEPFYVMEVGKAAARLGAQVRFAGPVGDDEVLPLFERHFRREGVDPSGLVAVAGARSSVAAVIVDAQGQRLIVSHLGDALQRRV